MKKIGLILAAAAACACSGQDAAYRRVPHGLPSNIKKVAIRMAANKTQQFGMEDRLMQDIRDEFLKDGTYPIVPEAEADGIAVPTITRYIVTPVQYDATLNPTAYKLDILLDLQFVERTTNTPLWEERNMEAFEIYPASTLPGGKTEDLAQADLWDELARDIVTRVVQGFGTPGSH